MSGQSPISDRNDPLRPFLKKAIAKMSVVARFDSAENDALESLVELYGALLQSIAEISKEYCEHGNRVVPLIQDVISGNVSNLVHLIHSGLTVTYACSHNSFGIEFG